METAEGKTSDATAIDDEGGADVELSPTQPVGMGTDWFRGLSGSSRPPVHPAVSGPSNQEKTPP